MMISMYFAVSWLEPRLVINDSAVEWIEDRTGPNNVSRESSRLTTLSLRSPSQGLLKAHFITWTQLKKCDLLK